MIKMRNRNIKITILGILLICLGIVSNNLSGILLTNESIYNDNETNLKNAGYWIVSPFTIDGNSGWETINSTYDWCSGSGTYDDPYIIENITIDGGGSGNCISINNTNEYFKIRNCNFTNAHCGIWIRNTLNGEINNTISSLLEYGIILLDSQNNSIIKNTIKNIARNGLVTGNSSYNLFQGNDIYNVTFSGFFIDVSSFNIIKENSAHNNRNGIFIRPDSKNNTIYMNNLYENHISNGTDNGIDNRWDHNYIGNYWGDYGGVDANDDGIGDTPHNITGTAGSQDNYPFWEDGDDLPPTINIISPTPNQLFGDIAPSFDVEIYDANLDTMWYTIDSEVTNITFTSNGPINQAAWNSLSEGGVILRFYANDSLGRIEFTEITIRKDSEAPIISVIEPSTNDVLAIAPAYELTITESNLDTIWYTLDGGENNFTVLVLTGIVNQELWDNLPNGYITVRFYANDTLGHLNFDEVIIVKDVPIPTSQPGIPGYNLFMFIGIISLMTVITIKSKYSKKIK